MPPHCSVPVHCWTLTETPPEPGEVMPYMNILKRVNFRLTNPDDASQVLYCTADRRAGGWQKRYASSQQANAAIFDAW